MGLIQVNIPLICRQSFAIYSSVWGVYTNVSKVSRGLGCSLANLNSSIFHVEDQYAPFPMKVTQHCTEFYRFPGSWISKLALEKLAMVLCPSGACSESPFIRADMGSLGFYPNRNFHDLVRSRTADLNWVPCLFYQRVVWAPSIARSINRRVVLTAVDISYEQFAAGVRNRSGPGPHAGQLSEIAPKETHGLRQAEDRTTKRLSRNVFDKTRTDRVPRNQLIEVQVLIILREWFSPAFIVYASLWLCGHLSTLLHRIVTHLMHCGLNDPIPSCSSERIYRMQIRVRATGANLSRLKY